MTTANTSNTAKIRELNDNFRKTLQGGRVMLTCGVRDKGAETVREVISRMQEYDNFSQDNDVYKEHDFGSIDNNGQRYFWKIDYYDQRLLMHSPDPADPDVTCRVLTVMLAEEY